MPEVKSAEELAEAADVDVEVIRSGDKAAGYLAGIEPSDYRAGVESSDR